VKTEYLQLDYSNAACKPGEYEEHPSGNCRFQYNAIYSWGNDFSGEFGVGVSAAEPGILPRTDNETIIGGSNILLLTDAGNVYLRFANNSMLQKIRLPFTAKAVDYQFSTTGSVLTHYLATNGSLFQCSLTIDPICTLISHGIIDLNPLCFLSDTGIAYGVLSPTSVLDLRKYQPKKLYSPIYAEQVFIAMITTNGSLLMFGGNTCKSHSQYSHNSR
jgi:uncharacterized membrane protein